MKVSICIIAVFCLVDAILPVPKIPKLPEPDLMDLLGILDPNNEPTTEEKKPVYPPQAANGGKEFAERKLEAASQLRAHWNALSQAERDEIKNRAETFGQAHQEGDVLSAGDIIARENAKTGLDFFDGDLMITKEQLDEIWPKDAGEGNRKKRQGYKTSAYPNNLWLDTQPIPYDLDSNLEPNAITLIQLATQWWADHTCISFAEGIPGPRRLNFTKGQGCWAWMGKTSFAMQEVSIGQNCDQFAVVAHEIGHALGFIHSQMRIDRDDYVDINLDNVQDDYKSAFNKYPETQNHNYELPYDYTSVMQYSPYAFAKNSSIPTVVAKAPYQLFQNSMGQTYPSFTDVVMMNELYKCYDVCAGYTTYWHNGGRMDVKNCSRCFCTPGFTGEFCTKPDLGTCGQLLAARETEATLHARAGLNSTAQPLYDECIYVLRAPVGMRVKMTVMSVGGGCTIGGGCAFGGVELRWQTDKRLPGYRYCCSADADGQPSVISETPTAVIYAFNRKNFNEAYIKYQAVP